MINEPNDSWFGCELKGWCSGIQTPARAGWVSCGCCARWCRGVNYKGDVARELREKAPVSMATHPEDHRQLYSLHLPGEGEATPRHNPGSDMRARLSGKVLAPKMPIAAS